MRLLALFPRRWRQRYGEEFEVLLEESDLSLGDLVDLARGAWDARLHPQPHLGHGGEEMATRLGRGAAIAVVAVAALVVLVALQTLRPLSATFQSTPDIAAFVAAATIFGVAAVALWRLGGPRGLWVLLALLAARILVEAVVDVALTLSSGPLTIVYWNIDPAGFGWLPPTLFELAAGVALVVVLAAFLRLRLVTALVIGLVLELLVGPSDLSLIRYLMLNGLEESVIFASPLVVGPTGHVPSALMSPLSYLPFVGSVAWATVLQQVALRPVSGGDRHPLLRSYARFLQAHWAPVGALVLIVVLARFPLPAVLKSDAVLNPAHYVPTATDSRTQFIDCLRAYGVNLAQDANTKTAQIPEGLANRCSNIINTYPDQVRGRPLPVPAPVTDGGVTYTVTSMQIAGRLLKISWRASGAPIDDFGRTAYPAKPPSGLQDPGFQMLLLQRRYLDASVFDGAGAREQGAAGGGGGTLPRTQPYAWYGQTNAYVTGPGQYTLQFGCVSPPPPPTGKGFQPQGPCVGGPVASVPIVVS
jgi:hypothetical protein